MFDIYLASQSPRRQELLRQIGVTFQAIPVDVDESLSVGEDIESYVSRLAQNKARAGAQVIGGSETPVLGADTALVLDNEILGKPKDFAHFKMMMQKLSGQTHEVVSGVSILFQDEVFSELSYTFVSFKPLSYAEIEAYWQTSEPQGKAGGYAIQGIGSVFVTDLEGSYSGVVGLPLLETSQLLARCGVSIFKQ